MSKPQTSPPNASNNVASLLFSFLLIISICLTAFNFYLFAWIRSNLGGAWGPDSLVPFAPAPNQTRSAAHLLARVSLRQPSGAVQFDSRLIGGKSLQFKRLTGSTMDGQGEPDEASALRVMSRKQIQLGGGGGGGADESEVASLIVDARQGSLIFANGLLVRARDTQRLFMSCEGEPGDFCLVKSPRLRLGAPTSRLDFSNKSIHLRQLHTRRLHSPMNKLQLMGAAGAEFSSRQQQVELQALDTLALGSRHSKVSLAARRKVAQLVQLAHERARQSQVVNKFFLLKHDQHQRALTKTNKQMTLSRSR